MILGVAIESKTGSPSSLTSNTIADPGIVKRPSPNTNLNVLYLKTSSITQIKVDGVFDRIDIIFNAIPLSAPAIQSPTLMSSPLYIDGSLVKWLP